MPKHSEKAAGLANMVLDALFIVVFQWGVAGAAIATGVSELMGGFLPFFYFLRPNSSLLRLTKTRLEGRILLKACSNGASELMSNISGSLVSMLYNFQLLRFAGEDGVAAYGVLMYIQFVFVAIFIGYTIGTAPVVSYHYGAGNHGRGSVRICDIGSIFSGKEEEVSLLVNRSPILHIF